MSHDTDKLDVICDLCGDGGEGYANYLTRIDLTDGSAVDVCRGSCETKVLRDGYKTIVFVVPEDLRA